MIFNMISVNGSFKDALMAVLLCIVASVIVSAIIGTITNLIFRYDKRSKKVDQ